MIAVPTEFYTFILPTLILIAGVADDLRSKKIHNKLVIILLAIAAVYQFSFFGASGLLQGLMASGLAFLIFVPMVLSKMLGAGDMKLMMAFGMSTIWVNVLWTGIYSLVWAAIFGVIYAISHKKLTALVVNTIDLAKFKKGASDNTLKIPYSIALLMGWLHQLVNVFVKGGGF